MDPMCYILCIHIIYIYIYINKYYIYLGKFHHGRSLFEAGSLGMVRIWEIIPFYGPTIAGFHKWGTQNGWFIVEKSYETGYIMI